MSNSSSSSLHPYQSLFKIRTITGFISLEASDFSNDCTTLGQKLDSIQDILQSSRNELQEAGYAVQTLRIATNSCYEWATSRDFFRVLDEKLQKLDLDLCSVGLVSSVDEALAVIQSSKRLSCSMKIDAANAEQALEAAECMLRISEYNVLGNFRFCATTCDPMCPFFPAARSVLNAKGFAVGLENGTLAHFLLVKCGSIANIATLFKEEMEFAVKPIDTLCNKIASALNCTYFGMDTSLNPSLQTTNGSVAAAIETLDEVQYFGGPGSLAAAAQITLALQSLNVKRTGYCGLMLPVCEDERLAQLSTLSICQLLNVSSVCGVGVDTVPVAGSISKKDLQSLIMDVAGLSSRWNKPLSCRVFPVPGLSVGETTTFDSPYLCNSKVMEL